MSVYSPLQHRLANATQASVTMSFEEIEMLLGRKLPPSAYDEQIKRQWWANTDTHSQARAWLRVGRKARLDAARNQVTFVRETGTTFVHDVPPADGLHIPRELLSGAATLMIRNLARDQGIDPSAAAATLLNDLALAQRRELLREIDRLREQSVYSDISSADLIREDRDAR